MRPHYYEKRPPRRGWRGLSFARIRFWLIVGFAIAVGLQALGTGAVERIFGPMSPPGDVARISFSLCGHGGPHYNCVIDGDTFYLERQGKYQLRKGLTVDTVRDCYDHLLGALFAQLSSYVIKKYGKIRSIENQILWACGIGQLRDFLIAQPETETAQYYKKHVERALASA